MRTPTAAWLYCFGDRPAWILARMRRDSFRDCTNVYHPGLFRSWSTMVQYRLRVQLPRARVIRARIQANGDAHAVLNGAIVWHSTDGGAARTLTLHLRSGDNVLHVLINRLDEPPTLRVDGDVVRSDARWEATLDMVDWEPAEAVAGPASRTSRPPHDVVLEERPIRLRLVGDGLYACDRLIVGRPDISVSGSGGITAYAGETPQEAQSTTGPHEQPPLHAAVDGSARVVGPPMALRWLRIASRGAARVTNVQVRAQSRGLPLRGRFACSDPLLDRIWTTSAATLANCMRELLVDGPKRDRLPWAGDLWVSTMASAVTYADTNVVADTLVALAPPDPHRRHVNNIIDYTAWWIIAIAACRTWLDGDAIAKRLWPTVATALDALAAGEGDDGFLRPKKDDWLFIDWVDMEKAGVNAPLQAIYLQAIDAGIELAIAADADPTPLRKRATRLRRRFPTAFWDSRRKRFVDAVVDGGMVGGGRHANTLAQLAGLVDQRRQPHVLAMLQDPTTPAVGTPYMHYLENAARCATGDMGGMLDDLRAYWGSMLDRDATTFWEAFDPNETGEDTAFYGRPFARSLCHAWAAGPAPLLSTNLFGLRPSGPGWSRIEWRPMALPLDWASATVPTPLGDCHVEWRRGVATLRAPAAATVDAPRQARRHRGRLHFQLG